MNVAILYDCIYPWTVGGAERWYVNLAERLAEDHEVTYLTLRQWEDADAPDEVYAVETVGPRMELYHRDGRRRIVPPLRFGWGVFAHLLRHGGRYDVVHGASFPYFSVIGAWVALRFHRKTKLVVDWHEVWSRSYWSEYLGAVGGPIGNTVQSICKRLPDHNFTFSKLFAERLPQRNLTRLTGEFREPSSLPKPRPAAVPPRVVFAGRLIPEKHAESIPAAIARLRSEIPGVTATIYGAGPETERVAQEVRRLGAEDWIDMPGFVTNEELDRGLAEASCLLHPSAREGYGLVVIEAASIGTPVVLVEGEDNAATELVESGVNGAVASTRDPEDLAAAIAQVINAGPDLRRSAREWYERNREPLSIDHSLSTVIAMYAELSGDV